MFRTIDVMNLATGEIRSYTNDLPIAQNVLNAYFQALGDYNWWNYTNRPHPPIEHGKHTIICGDWSAFADGRRIRA